MIIVLMGVSGSGKSTIGAALGAALSWPFLDADDFHPPENVAKMAAGVPLTDDDRGPWLDRIVANVRGTVAGTENAVLACSALKQAYRDRLLEAGDVRFVHLDGDRSTIAARLAERRHRYMPAALLDSQFATLEVPRAALRVDMRNSVAVQVQTIIDALQLPGAAQRPDESQPWRDRS